MISELINKETMIFGLLCIKETMNSGLINRETIISGLLCIKETMNSGLIYLRNYELWTNQLKKL